MRTARDDRLLDFAGRFGAVTLRQAARSFYGGVVKTTRHRVQRMVEAGLLERSDNLRWAGTVVWPTNAGMRAVHTGGPRLESPYAPADERMLHRLLVADNALRMSARNLPLISEREIRSAELESAAAAERLIVTHRVSDVTPSVDATGRDRWLCVPIGSGERQHWPDFIVPLPTSLMAVEVEIYRKERTRLMQVLRGYRDAVQAGHIGQVMWLVTPDVQAELEGYRDPTGQWIDGLLQRLQLLPVGPPDWNLKGLPMVVRAVSAEDDGVQYGLDQRILPAAARCSYRRWKQWRTVWKEQAGDVPFVMWVRVSTVLAMLKKMR